MAVSIIIKTLNEQARIAAAIESALAALGTVPGEVIIADSGSTDDTIAIASRYPVVIAQLVAPARPSCGIGPQLGFQHSRGDYLCLIDGDMQLDQDFLAAAIRELESDPKLAGVTGHVEEMQVSSLEFARRVQRGGAEFRVGSIDRMNGGGLYRRSAIADAGYLTDRNLHGHEEFELGIRLRSRGWQLRRIDRRFVRHFGHTINSYRLLLRRWTSKYLQGTGEVLRAALGRPYFIQVLRELPELRLWAAVYLLWALCLLLIVALPNKAAALLLVVALFAGLVAIVSRRKGSVRMGLYTVVAWFFHAAALPIGFFRARLQPDAPIESRIVGSA
ncbi:glycosyltransferase involved in cell wall biosynthesis [Rhodopseudomonas rhenobacensis]|uniref:Glycosyltransferase involved in cell wall biosynthesis n=1 Tax=Rhodopseudomonas rhenobacensis TaxID=87461 RepID=A0A7W7Z7M2_9BRAD|nr:glycosyltransferase family 2 protein [Rhodopseudomonas rhenobacensis]MBB5049363.1 glycosyltransferase involved in cell wall biosynthesis [Rhodopseudomonas rhenobacensis]